MPLRVRSMEWLGRIRCKLEFHFVSRSLDESYHKAHAHLVVLLFQFGMYAPPSVAIIHPKVGDWERVCVLRHKCVEEAELLFGDAATAGDVLKRVKIGLLPL